MDLLLLTKFYPYGTGEAFLENEIDILSKKFNRILVIACEVPENVTSCRNVPKNVLVKKISASSKKVDAIKGITKYFFASDTLLKSEYKKLNKLSQRLFLSYFEEKSQRVFRKIVKNKYIDLISDNYIIYSYWLFMTARVGTLINEVKKSKKMFSRTHRYDLYANQNSLGYLPYREYFLEKYDMVFPCSNNGTDYLTNNYPKFNSKIRTALLGTMDYGVGKSSEDGIFRIVSCSRLNPVKRVTKIVDTLQLLDNVSANIEWHHIGDGEEFEKINESAKKLTNIKCILYGNLKNEEVLKMYQTYPYDLFINVSSSEGLPVSIMEAMSFGIPVIATDVGGTNEIVFDNVTGKLIPANFSNDELKNNILFYMNMDEVDYKLNRENCRNIWEQKFQAEVNYSNFCELLK